MAHHDVLQRVGLQLDEVEEPVIRGDRSCWRPRRQFEIGAFGKFAKGEKKYKMRINNKTLVSGKTWSGCRIKSKIVSQQKLVLNYQKRRKIANFCQNLQKFANSEMATNAITNASGCFWERFEKWPKFISPSISHLWKNFRKGKNIERLQKKIVTIAENCGYQFPSWTRQRCVSFSPCPPCIPKTPGQAIRQMIPPRGFLAVWTLSFQRTLQICKSEKM